MLRAKSFIIHPFLFAIAPILYLYSYNKFLVSFSDVLKPLSISLGIVILLYVLFALATRRFKEIRETSAVFLSIILIFFFSYGHIYNVMIRILGIESPLTIRLVKDTILAIFGILFLGFSLYLFRTSDIKRSLANFTRFLNFSALMLLIIPLINIGIFEMKVIPHLTARLGAIDEDRRIDKLFSSAPETLPDIYYIVLDGYGRADILKEIYGYDNSQFLNWLTSKGFYIATKSKTNYSQSCLSVASFLNFEYINFLKDKLGEASQDRRVLVEMIKNNKVARLLKRLGYKFINIHTDYFCITRSPIADLNIDPSSSFSNELFEDLLLSTTALKPMLENFPLSTSGMITKRRNRILNAFRNLEKIPDIKAPTFVYAHIVAPHPPFLFGPNGEKVIQGRFCLSADGDHWWKRCGSKEDYIQGYRNQLIYINKKIGKMVEEILSRSETSPIIILQADHGPGAMLEWENPDKTYMPERMGIFNAYYLPGGGQEVLYDSITPVNSFRIIFNHYFGTDYELLEDKSYFSTWSKPYQFIEVTNEETSY